MPTTSITRAGCLLNENLGWGSTMLSYLSRSPDPAIVGDSWGSNVDAAAGERAVPACRLAASPTPRRRLEAGSVCEEFVKIRAATLAIGGWGDGYKNAVSRLVEDIDAPVKGIIGPRIHKYPHFAVPKPAIGFLQEALRWWDRWLKSKETGVENDPAMRLYLMDLYRRAIGTRSGRAAGSPSINGRRRGFRCGPSALPMGASEPG